MNEDRKVVQIQLKTETKSEMLKFKTHENEMGLFPRRAKQRADAEGKVGEIVKTQLPRERRKIKTRVLRIDLSGQGKCTYSHLL